jgi:hypothetical protein
MWYCSFVVRSRARQTAITAASHPLGPAKKSTNSSPCHTSAIFTRSSFARHTYKNKRLKVLCLPHIFKIHIAPAFMANRVAA